MEWVITIIQSLINVKAVMFAVVATQFVKRILPAKELTNGENPTRFHKWTVKDGPLLTRVVPLLPMLFAVVMTFFLERDSRYTLEDFIRGVASGAFAGYTYSTTKTLIFGG